MVEKTFLSDAMHLRS